jgi:putative ABC transport system substrate-binding protein
MQRSVHRRQLVAILGAMTLATSGRARAPGDRMRTVGVMMAVAENDPEGKARLDTFRRGLAEAGWVDERNTTITTRWYQGRFEDALVAARDLVGRGVDAILVNGTPGMDALRAAGATMPIVFVVVSNPLGAGYIPSLSHPGGNITGFSTFEPDIAGKWLQLLCRIAPNLKHVAMLLDPKFTAFNTLWQALAETAPQLGVVPHAAHAGNPEEIERALELLAARDGPGLIVTPGPVYTVKRKRLVELANERRVPAIYPFRFYLREGGLMTYGFNATDQFRRAADYVGRILKGEKPGDLPVQAPSLFELGINLRTARTIGISVPQSLLIIADEVIS